MKLTTHIFAVSLYLIGYATCALIPIAGWGILAWDYYDPYPRSTMSVVGAGALSVIAAICYL